MEGQVLCVARAVEDHVCRRSEHLASMPAMFQQVVTSQEQERHLLRKKYDEDRHQAMERFGMLHADMESRMLHAHLVQETTWEQARLLVIDLVKNACQEHDDIVRNVHRKIQLAELNLQKSASRVHGLRSQIERQQAATLRGCEKRTD